MAARFEGSQVCNDPELFAFIEPLCLVSGSGDSHELEVQLHPKFLHHPCTQGCNLRVVVTYGSAVLADARGASISCDGCIRVAITGTQQLPPGVLDVMLIASPPDGQEDARSPGSLISCTLLPILPAEAAEEMALLFEDMMMDADRTAPGGAQQGKALPTSSILCEPAVSDILLTAASQTVLSCCTAPTAPTHPRPGPTSGSTDGPSTTSLRAQQQQQQVRAPWFVDLMRAAVWAHHYQPLLADLRLALGPGVLRSGGHTLTLGSAAPASSGTTACAAAGGSSSSSSPHPCGPDSAAERSGSHDSRAAGEETPEGAACRSSSSSSDTAAAEDAHSARRTALFLLLCRAEVVERLSQYFWENDMDACCDMVHTTGSAALFSPSSAPAPADAQQPQQQQHGQHAVEQPCADAQDPAPCSLASDMDHSGSSSAAGDKKQGLPFWLSAGVAAWRTVLRTVSAGTRCAARGRGSKGAGVVAGARLEQAACPAAVCSLMLLLVALCWLSFRWCMASGDTSPASCRPVMLHWTAELMPHMLLAACPSVLQRLRERLRVATAMCSATLVLLLLHQGLLPVHIPRSYVGGWLNVLCFGLLYSYLREVRFGQAASVVTVLGACKWWLLGCALPNLQATRLLLLVAYGSSSVLALLLDYCSRRAIVGPVARCF